MTPSRTRVSKTGCGAVAGPRSTLPSDIRKMLPCQGQVRQPFSMSLSDSRPGHVAAAVGECVQVTAG
jgi:hypothetical protein